MKQRTILILLLSISAAICLWYFYWTSFKPATSHQIENSGFSEELSVDLRNARSQKDKIKILKKAFISSNSINDDSIKKRLFLDLASKCYSTRADSLFRISNSNALRLSIKLSDTFGIADAYWNFGNYYFRESILDSAYLNYSEAATNFEEIDSSYHEGRMLYNMALIEGRIKDYTKSEISTINAISKFDVDSHPLNLYQAYNHLGILFYELNEFEKSVSNYERAQDYLSALPSKGTYPESLMNNLALVYCEKKEFTKAIALLDKALLNSKTLKQDNLPLYARIIDNLAYGKLLVKDTLEVHDLFKESLSIRTGMHHKAGIIISELHFAQYYLFNKDTLGAISAANRSEDLASQIGNLSAQLDALKFLGGISGARNLNYLNKYIEISDGIYKEERRQRNKFTRLRFETDEFKKKTEKLSEDMVWIAVIGSSTIVVLLLLYFLNNQRSKNKELMFEQEQQRNNEEIYELLLKQQHKLEEGRDQERKRISRELHDGILGQLFGIRINLGLLDLSGSPRELDRLGHYNTELQLIEKEIRSISHTLNSNIFEREIGFMQILESLIKKQSSVGGFSYNFINDTEINWILKDELFKIHIYRIVQEAIHNTIKYAEATCFTLKISEKGGVLYLQIKDDGKGFDMSKSLKNGIGFLNIKYRVQAMQAGIKIKSRPGNGTILHIMVKNF